MFPRSGSVVWSGFAADNPERAGLLPSVWDSACMIGTDVGRL
jgi:hypothetical protein